MKLDYLKMLQDIDSLLENDWSFDMELKLVPDSEPFTQKEAEEMAKVLGTIYSIAHCIRCRGCQSKYLLKENEKKVVN